MVTIRLARFGAKKRPFYHIVVADKRMPRDGRRIERIGYYNPNPRGADKMCELDLARVDYWLSVGAQMSDRVGSLVKIKRKEAQAA